MARTLKDRNKRKSDSVLIFFDCRPSSECFLVLCLDFFASNSVSFRVSIYYLRLYFETNRSPLVKALDPSNRFDSSIKTDLNRICCIPLFTIILLSNALIRCATPSSSISKALCKNLFRFLMYAFLGGIKYK